MEALDWNTKREKINKRGESIDISYNAIKHNKTLAEFIPSANEEEDE